MKSVGWQGGVINWAFTFAVGPYDVFLKRGDSGSFPLRSSKINFNTTQTLLVSNSNSVMNKKDPVPWLIATPAV